MILIICQKCFSAIRLLEDDGYLHLVGPGSDFWPSKFTCLNCDAINQTGYMEDCVDVSMTNKLKIRDLTPLELYCVQIDLGAPEEQVCTFEKVKELLECKRIKSVAGEDIKGTNRCVLTTITLEDGTRVYLASSTRGATVYRVRAPFSYTEEVTNG